MDYETLALQRRTHPAWRLLRADNAPLVVSFLQRSFLEPNVRSQSEREAAARLEDHLFHIRDRHGAELFPKAAAHYLQDWCSEESGWLRRYYPPEGDEPFLDLTPAAEKAVDWLASLKQQPFVATESRLLMVFELFREIVERTETDPAARIGELEKRRAQIDAEIERVRQGRVELMDATRIKDRFLQASETARALLSDFRAVEQNFRDLDRAVRERIAAWEGGKGELLQDIFGEHDQISDSDQGRSFRAFWDFLMSAERQEELSSLLEETLALPAVQELAPDPRLRRIHYDWLDAGEVAQRTVARLSEQLRRFLDDQAWQENRRIMQILKAVEQHALAVRATPPANLGMALDEARPGVELSLERPLYAVPLKTRLVGDVAEAGDGDAVPADALFEQVWVDKRELLGRIRHALREREQITLGELVQSHPIRQGLSELVAYLSLAVEGGKGVIDDEREQQVTWTDERGRSRQATLPLVVFSR